MTDDGRQGTEDRGRATEGGRPMTDNDSRPQSPNAISGFPSPASRLEPHGLQSPVTGPATYKFQSLQVYQLALDYLDEVYGLAYHLPDVEKFNLRSQLERAGTSIVLNIAEGSTGQSDPEQSRFTSMALRSYLETVACFDIAERRGYLASGDLQSVRNSGHQLFIKLSALRRSLSRSVSRPQSQNPSPVFRPRSS
jgi:four helix bundle protein